MTSLRIKTLVVACAAWLLTTGSALAQVQQPYLVMIPGSGPPDTAEMGSQVGVYGTGFCQTGCSPVNLTIGNDIVAPSSVATVQVNPDGTFVQQIAVNVPFAWRYLITATQTTGTGTTLSASVPMIVPQGDEVPGNTPPPIPQNQPQANERGPQAVPRRAQPKTTVHTLLAGVTEVPPNEAFDGRSVAIDVSTSNNAVAIAASESGGLWKTTNTGANWSLLSGLPTFRMSDVKMAPSNDQIVIATSWFDSHVTNGGGIWRSIDGGANWAKPATADPTPGLFCPTPFNTWGISFAPGTSDVFVGTDCGVSVSHDLGSSWSHVTLAPVYAISAQAGASGTIVDTCGADGHHRSTNSGAIFTPFSSALPACPFIGVHTIAVSPLEPNVLFGAIDETHLYESDNAGASWTNLNPSTDVGGREAWVATHLSADGNPNHFDIYFGSGLNAYRQTCTNTGGPGLRCSTSWNTVTLDHSDQNGLAFSTSGNCAQYIVSDGGVHITSDCGGTWTITGNGAGGYHALQVYEMTGEVHPAGTDLYFGTQDNNLWASANNGSTWINPYCCEGFFIQTLHDSPSDSGQTITFAACGPPCPDHDSTADFASVTGWNNPPGGGGDPFIVDQGVYLEWSAPSKPTNQLYLSIDTGGSWTAIPGASTTLQLVDHPFISGPPANPTVYQQVKRAGGVTGLIKITGVRSGSATITNADTGLNNIGFWSMGQGTFRWQQVFGVDPNNPLHLIAGDIGLNEMMVSIDGGMSWNPDSHLTDLVTDFGQFQFSQPSTTFPGLTTEAHAIAFDPSNGNRILVGTEQAGIIVSTDGGTTWGVISGSNSVPAVSSFFFDEVQKDVMASSYGRGLWTLDLTQLVVFPPVITKGFAASTTPLNGVVALTFSISNPTQTAALTGVAFTDTLPAGLVVSTPNGLSGSCGGGTITAVAGSSSISLAGAILATSATCTFSVNVTGIAGGIDNNSVTVNSTNGGPGNTSTASITVILPPTIKKSFAPTIIQAGNTSTLSFTITNPNMTPLGTLTFVGFTDILPPGVSVSTSSGTCDGGSLIATSGSGLIELAGAFLPDGASCTFSVVVVGNTPGVKNNTTGPVNSLQGGSGSPSLATLTVLSPPTITKSFADSQVDLFFGSTALSFTITNPAANPLPLTGIAFTDTLPGSPPGLIVSTPDNGLTGSCGGGTIAAVPASDSISLSGATLAPGASCTFSVNVTGAAIGVQVNTTSNITASGPISLIGSPATATTTVVATEFLWFFLESGGGRP
jgi:uncharacterized repeat protein (TIGR01451 family)